MPMKIRAYSLEEMAALFKKSAWGNDEDYKGFYRGSFPEQEIVKQFTNAELLAKYWDWIDTHQDDKNKYFSGYALHCRYEMGRRLREGIEKFESGSKETQEDQDGIADSSHEESKPTYDDVLFQNAFPAFLKSVTNLLQECYEDFGGKVAEMAKARTRPGWSVNPFLPRYDVYRGIAKKIGVDFLVEFERTIKPYCGNISDSSMIELLKLFNLRYDGAVVNAEQGLKRFCASRGIRDNIEPYLLPARGIYRNAQHKYWNRVEAEILKHNLEVSVHRKVEFEPLSRVKSKEPEPKQETNESEETKHGQRVHDAVAWCVRRYNKQKANHKKNISKRGIALEAVGEYFNHLTGKQRAQMIDNLRKSYLKKVK